MRRWLIMTTLAGVAAAALGASPLLIGAGGRTNPATLGFLNQAEQGTFDHNLAHRASSPAAKKAAIADALQCGDQAWRAANPESCPEPGATTGEVRAARTLAAAAPAAGQPADGLWGPLQKMPSTAIHGVVMPTGKVLYFSQPKLPQETEEVDGGTAHVWDPATGQSRAVPPPVVAYEGRDAGAITAPANLWCAGQTLLPDGRVLVVGGNLEYPTAGGLGDRAGFKGGRWVMTFDPWTETWTRYADMRGGRWYPTLTTLPNGTVLIVGGWDATGGDAGGNPSAAPAMRNNQDVEVFDPALATGPGAVATEVVSQLPPNGDDQTTPYPDHRNLGLYPHMFVLPDTTEAGEGDAPKVLVAGPLQWDSAIIDTEKWTWTDVLEGEYDPGDVPLSSDRAWGTAYLEPSGPEGSARVVMLGGSNSGAAAPGGGASPPPLATAEVLDLDDPGAGWTLDPDLDLRTGRAHFNTVLLPDGSIFSNGGGVGRADGSMYADPIYTSELLAPGGEGGWRTVGAEADARTYHSTSLLLPDGRVISAGDDRDIAPAPSPGAGMPAGHIALASRTYQLYNPPYLFRGARPAVTFAPQRARYDAPFRAAVQGDPAAVTTAYLMRPGAVTHAVDMSQQAIALEVTAQSDGLTLTTPLNATVAPPGYYMLFLGNAAGAVSSASWIRLDPNAPDAPPLPLAPLAAASGGQAALAPAPSAPSAIGVAPTATAVRPRLRVTGARATLRGRTITVTMRVTSNRNATLSARAGRATGRRTLRAGRPATLVLRLRAGVVPPRSVRVALSARDARGARATLRPTVRVVRLG